MAANKNRIRIMECSICFTASDIICEACGTIDTSSMHTAYELTFMPGNRNYDFWHCDNCDMWTLTKITDDTSFTCEDCKSDQTTLWPYTTKLPPSDKLVLLPLNDD